VVARRSDSRRPGVRSRFHLLTDPAAPAVLLTVTALGGVVAGRPSPMLWAALGGVAGYSLSGSV
jgi:hypothetical protein